MVCGWPQGERAGGGLAPSTQSNERNNVPDVQSRTSIAALAFTRSLTPRSSGGALRRPLEPIRRGPLGSLIHHLPDEANDYHQHCPANTAAGDIGHD